MSSSLSSSPIVSAAVCVDATVSASQRNGKYREADPVQLISDAFAVPRSVAAQMLKPSDPRCPFPRSAQMSEALYAGGRGDVAEGLRMPLDRARYRSPMLSVDEMLLLETEIEGAANNAQQAYSMDHSPGALDTLIRRWEKQIEVLQMAVLTVKRTRAER